MSDSKLNYILSKLLAYILISEQITSYVLVYNNQTESLVSRIQSNSFLGYCCAWFNINQDIMFNDKYKLPKQQFFFIFLIKNFDNLNKSMKFRNNIWYPNDKSIIVLDGYHNDTFKINNILRNRTIANTGVIRLNENQLEIFSFNPFDDKGLNRIIYINSTFSQDDILKKIGKQIFYDKFQNVYQATLKAYPALDIGTIYRKLIRYNGGNVISLGGPDTYAIQLIAQLLNASLDLRLEDDISVFNHTDCDYINYVNFISKAISTPFDTSKPIKFKTVSDIDENW